MKANTKMGEIHHMHTFATTAAASTGINFADTSGQQRPEEDMLSGEKDLHPDSPLILQATLLS